MNLKDVPVIDLDLYYRESNQPDYLKTDDANGRYRKYRLAYGGTPMDLTGVTARCYMMKADGKSVYIDAEIEGNVVTVCFTNQALACPGVLKVEIVLYGSDNSEISSFIMEYVVIKSLRNPDTLESTNEFSALVSTINTVNDLQAKEQLIQAREAIRIANEDTRIATEATRESDEETRKSNEATRQSNETTRIASENTREGKEFTRQQDEITRKANEVTRQSNETGRVNAESTRVAEFNDIKNQWNSLSPDQASNVEVQQARRDVKGVVHDSLSKRLESDSKMRDTLEETKEGTYLTFDGSVPSPITNVIVKGNTYQNPNNLVEIVSSGIDNGDGTWTYEVVACGENLLNEDAFESGALSESNGQLVSNSTMKTSDFIKVSIGNDYILNTNGYHLHLYDKSKKWIKRLGVNKFISDVDGYVRISVSNATNQIKLQEGTVATPYTPYQETRCDIKLPCQLEKVWETSDKLYYDTVNASWCVAKVIDTLDPLDYTWYRAEQYTNCSRMAIKDGSNNSTIGAKSGVLGMVSNALTFMSGNQDEPHLRIDGGLPYGNVNVYIEGLNASESELKAFAKAHDMFIKYIRRDAKIIELPQSEQIKLNSFANKTHIYVNSGALDAIISATVAKSHTSATQANTDKIIDVENRLQKVIDNKDDVEYTYKSTNGYVIAKDTNRGNISKATINGKSLVNLCPKRTTRAVSDGVGHVGDTIYLPYALDDSKKYTIMFKITDNSTTDKAIIGLYDKDGSGKASFVLDDIVLLNKGKYMYKTVTLDSRYTEAVSIKVLCRPTSPVGTVLEVDDLMLIEGTIDEVLPYINGIGSVSNPNGLELKTIDDGNLFNGKFVKKTVSGVDGTLVPGTEYLFSTEDIIRVQPGIRLRYKSTGTRGFRPGTNTSVYFYDSFGKLVFRHGVTTFDAIAVPTNAYGVRLTFTDFELANVDVANYDMVLTQIGDLTKGSQTKIDTHKIFYRDNDGEYQVLTELQEFDTLDLTNCKYTQRTGEVVSTDIKDAYVVATKTDNFVIGFDLVNKADGANLGRVISDKYAFIGDDEHVQIRLGNSGNSIFISDRKTKFTSLDKNGALAYIKANPFTAIYPLKDYTTYETNALSLDVFDGDTLVTTNATNVKPGFGVTITSSINSLIGNIDDTLDSAVDDIQAIKHDVAKITSSKAYEFNGIGSKVMNDTEQGTLSELQIYGKSLVNICTNDYTKSNVGIYYHTLNSALLSVGDTLTIKPFNNSDVSGIEWGLYGMPTGGSATVPILQYTFDFSQRSLTLPSGYTYYRLYVRKYDGTQYVAFDISKIKICAVVGSGDIVGYFDGLASIGNGKEIEVLSVKGDGNLCNFTSYTTPSTSGTSSTQWRVSFPKDIDKFYYKAVLDDGTVIASSNIEMLFYTNDGTKVFTRGLYDSPNGATVDRGLLNNVTYLKLYSNANFTNKVIAKLIISTNPITNLALAHVSDTKPILYKDVDNTWKPVKALPGIDANRRDIIDTNSGLYTNALNMITETGSGSWQISDNSKTDTVMFLRMFTQDEKCELLENNANILCDRLRNRYVYSNDVEGIFINRNMASSNGGVYIRINRSSLSTPDVPGLTKWLQANNVSYLYKRGDIRTYEINPILTQVFDNSTLLQILGGAISADFTAKCIASYSRRIESIESRLDRVEESVFKAVDVVSAMAMSTDLRSIDLSNNVEQTQRAQDTMLMESDMRLMSMELIVNSTKPVSTDIKYVMYDAKGGATIMSASYYNFIAMCIANKTQSPEYLENYMNLCLQTGRLDQDEFDKLHAMLYPTTTEQPTK